DAGARGEKVGTGLLTRVLPPADHHAVTPFEAPNTAAGAYIHVVDALRCEFLGAANVVDIVGVSAIDEDVACLEVGRQVGDGFVDGRRGNHQPHCPRLFELFQEVRKRSCSHCAFLRQFAHRFRRQIEDNAVVPLLDQTSRHVGAHSSESYHSKLHKRSSSKSFQLTATWVIAARSVSMAAPTPSFAPNIDDPATSTFAPAATTSGAVASSM